MNNRQISVYVFGYIAKHRELVSRANEKRTVNEDLWICAFFLVYHSFAVFGLGSSAYPNFCAFGRFIDNMLAELGGERISRCATGDELCGQEQAFNDWSKKVFEDACEVFCIGDEMNLSEVMKSATMKPAAFSADNVRLEPVEQQSNQNDLSRGLSKGSNRKLVQLSVLSIEPLYEIDSDGRKTISVQLEAIEDVSTSFTYLPGDHLGVYPENNPQLVADIVARLPDINFDQTYRVLTKNVKIEMLTGREIEEWIPHERLAPTSLREALTRYFDITTPPSQQLLSLMSIFAENESEQNHMKELASDSRKYEEWKAIHVPNFLEVLQFFPSLKPKPEFIFTQLSPLQPRFYSISSSPAYNQLMSGGDDTDCTGVNEFQQAMINNNGSIGGGSPTAKKAMSFKTKSMSRPGTPTRQRRTLSEKARTQPGTPTTPINLSMSSSETNCRRVDLTVAVVGYRTHSGATHSGVCSTFLANCRPGQTIFGFIRSAPNFRLPDSEDAPIIMVGPGTGIAPFRG